MNEQLQPTPSSDEISLKELIQKVQATLAFLLGYRWRLLLLGLLGGTLGFGYAHFFKKVTYTSRLTFVVEEKSVGGVGNLAGIASQFGFDFGGNGGGLFTSDNLILLLRSQRIIESCLLMPLPELAEGNLLNVYLKEHFEKPLKKGKIHLIDISKSRTSFSRSEDSTLHVVIDLVQKATHVARVDKKASIIELEVSDSNEKWAYLMSVELMEKAKNLYLELKTGKTERTIMVLENRVDSVKTELDGLMGAVAVNADQNQGLVLMRARVPSAKKQMQIQLLSTMYGELVKNLELTRFALEREEPIIVIIDNLGLPLYKEGKKRIYAAFFWFLATVLLGGGYLVLRRLQIL